MPRDFSPAAELCQSALDIVNGDRQAEYGDPIASFTAIAKTWSELFKTDISALDVALSMIELKVIRMSNGGSEDTLRDIIGYTAIAYMIYLEDMGATSSPKIERNVTEEKVKDDFNTKEPTGPFGKLDHDKIKDLVKEALDASPFRTIEPLGPITKRYDGAPIWTVEPYIGSTRLGRSSDRMV